MGAISGGFFTTAGTAIGGMMQSPEQISTALQEQGFEQQEAQRQARIIGAIANGQEISGNEAATIATSPVAVSILSEITGEAINTDAPLSEVKKAIKALPAAVTLKALPAGRELQEPTSKPIKAPGLIPSGPTIALPGTYDKNAISEAAATLGQNGQKAISKSYDGTIAPDVFFGDFARHYNAGQSGKELASVKRGSLSEAQAFTAWASGQNDASTTDLKPQKQSDTIKEENVSTKPVTGIPATDAKAYAKKLPRAAANVFRKWAANEWVSIDLADANRQEEITEYIAYFDKWFNAGKTGIRTIDVKHSESDFNFPPFLEEVFYNEGKKAVAKETKSEQLSQNSRTQKQKTIQEYENSVDGGIIEYIQDIRNNLDSKEIYKIGEISEQASKDLSDLLGFDTTGFNIVLNSATVKHIDNRHGVNGKQDHSMADDNDVARIKFILSNYDNVVKDPTKSKAFSNANGKPAAKVVYSKQVDGTYYVVVAVPNSKAKTVYVVSAYKTKAASQAPLTNAVGSTSDNAPVNTAFSDTNISAKSNGVNYHSTQNNENNATKIEEGAKKHGTEISSDQGTKNKSAISSETSGRTLENVVSKDVQGTDARRDPVSDAGNTRGESRGRTSGTDAERNGRGRSLGDREGSNLPATGEVTSEETPEQEAVSDAVAEKEEQASTENPKGENFVIGNSLRLPNGEKARFNANLADIKTVKKLISEDRFATPDEQIILSKYVGWGGLANAFDERKEAWAKEYKKLKELLTEEEYKSARASTLNAHYTSIEVIRAMYEGLSGLGFKGGRMLEPSGGTGNFIGAMPANMSNTVKSWTMVELDSMTGNIAKYLYPNADVRVQGFEKAIPRNFESAKRRTIQKSQRGRACSKRWKSIHPRKRRTCSKRAF